MSPSQGLLPFQESYSPEQKGQSSEIRQHSPPTEHLLHAKKCAASQHALLRLAFLTIWTMFLVPSYSLENDVGRLQLVSVWLYPESPDTRPSPRPSLGALFSIRCGEDFRGTGPAGPALGSLRFSAARGCS